MTRTRVSRTRSFSTGIPAAAVTALLLIGCGSAEPGSSPEQTAADCIPLHDNLDTIEPGVLTVAQYDYPPFSMLRGDELTGIEGEIITTIAELECLQLKLVPGEGSAMITSVQTGRADTTLGSWYRTAARAEVVRLSEPVVTSPFSVVSTSGASTVDDIVALDSVGAGQGLVGIEELQQLLGDRLKLYPTDDALFSDFQTGRVDAIVLGLGAAVRVLELYPLDGAVALPIAADSRLSATMDVGQTNFPVRIGNDSLGAAIDQIIRQLRADGVIAELAVAYGFPAEIAEPGTPNLL